MLRAMVVLAALGVAACGGGAGAAPGQPAPVPTSVEVQSNHALPVDIYVNARGYSRRLGTVHPGMSSHFEVPQAALVNGGVLELEVRPASGSTFRSGDLILSPGAIVDLVVQARVFASTATIRNP